MATSPVRIGEDDKALLEQLRRALGEASGGKPTQQETLGAALAFALRHRAEFLSEATWRPLTKKQLDAWVARIEALGGFDPVAPEDIDDVVYGDG